MTSGLERLEGRGCGGYGDWEPDEEEGFDAVC